MEKETFLNLIEIQSLDNKVLSHQKIINENQKRIDFLNTQRINRQTILNKTLKEKIQLGSELSKNESLLEELGSKLEHAQKGLHDITDQRQEDALNSEIESLRPRIEEEEDKTFLLMEKIEELEDIIKNSESYLKGSLESLNEIQIEVSDANNKEEIKIKHSEERITFLINSLEGHIKVTFESTYNKYRFKNPISIVERDICPNCSLSIPPYTIQGLEKSVSLEICPGCERILVPNSARKI